MSYYKQHIFFCTNLRSNGKKSCGQGNAEELRNYAKQKLKKAGLHGVGLCRVSSSGCLGRCEEGPIVVIYPEGKWYKYKDEKDIDEIIEKSLKGPLSGEAL